MGLQSFQFTRGENLALHVMGKVRPNKMDNHDAGISVLFKELVEIVKQMDELDVQFLSNDGRVIGQEKAEILRTLEDSLVIILKILIYLLKSNPVTMEVKNSSVANGKLNAQILDMQWVANGTFSYPPKELQGSPHPWIQNVIRHELKKIIINYAKFSEDGEMDSSEIEQICKEFQILFFAVLMIIEAFINGRLG